MSCLHCTNLNLQFIVFGSVVQDSARCFRYTFAFLFDSTFHVHIQHWHRSEPMTVSPIGMSYTKSCEIRFCTISSWSYILLTYTLVRISIFASNSDSKCLLRRELFLQTTNSKLLGHIGALFLLRPFQLRQTTHREIVYRSWYRAQQWALELGHTVCPYLGHSTPSPEIGTNTPLPCAGLGHLNLNELRIKIMNRLQLHISMHNETRGVNCTDTEDKYCHCVTQLYTTHGRD